MLDQILVFPIWVKYNFTERGSKFRKRKDKTFSQKKKQPNYLFMKLKQFKRTRTGKKKQESSSEEEHKVNALASGAEEGRDKLRKAAGSCK